MRISDIQELGKEILDLLQEYSRPPDKELLIDPILFAYLSGRFSRVHRQHPVYLYGSNRPQRIDFRFGGNNPVVLELAVRPPRGGGTLSGGQNTSELRKLCRVSHTQARLRALLLLDLCDNPVTKESLIATYNQVNAGRGRFKRCSVRVIYVHSKSTFHFRWNPYK